MEPVDSKIIACRNCKSPKILRLANSAYVYPFFAYRVWGIRSASMGTDRCQTAIIMDGVICEECGFLSTWIEIPEVCLGGLYKDYRSPTYNQERGYFEPGYVENIAKHIGGPSEALNRVAALDDYFQRLQLKGLFSQESILLALDWGGADGRFMPTLNKTTKKFVYEISDKPSIDNVIKKTELCNDDRFDIIVVAHVLGNLWATGVRAPFEIGKAAFGLDGL